MRTRLATLLAIAVATAAMAFAIGGLHASPSHPIARASLPTTLRSYLGVFEDGAPPAYDPIADFAAAAGRTPTMVGYYSGWAEPFDTSFADSLHSHRITPFVQIDPTYASVSGIVQGLYDDSYLRPYADSVRNFGHAVVIGFGHEMNTTEYKWGYGQVPASTFVAAWRHIVNLFRAQGADNVTWLWTINVDDQGSGPIENWWPGGQYVSWVGIDGYYYRPSDTFASVFGRTIDQVRALTSRPILLSETAVGPEAGQVIKILDLFEGMAKYKTLGLVWFDETQHGSILHQDWRIEDGSYDAGLTFRVGVKVYMVPAGSG